MGEKIVGEEKKQFWKFSLLLFLKQRIGQEKNFFFLKMLVKKKKKKLFGQEKKILDKKKWSEKKNI